MFQVPHALKKRTGVPESGDRPECERNNKLPSFYAQGMRDDEALELQQRVLCQDLLQAAVSKSRAASDLDKL